MYTIQDHGSPHQLVSTHGTFREAIHVFRRLHTRSTAPATRLTIHDGSTELLTGCPSKPNELILAGGLRVTIDAPAAVAAPVVTYRVRHVYDGSADHHNQVMYAHSRDLTPFDTLEAARAAITKHGDPSCTYDVIDSNGGVYTGVVAAPDPRGYQVRHAFRPIIDLPPVHALGNQVMASNGNKPFDTLHEAREAIHEHGSRRCTYDIIGPTGTIYPGIAAGARDAGPAIHSIETKWSWRMQIQVPRRYQGHGPRFVEAVEGAINSKHPVSVEIEWVDHTSAQQFDGTPFAGFEWPVARVLYRVKARLDAPLAEWEYTRGVNGAAPFDVERAVREAREVPDAEYVRIVDPKGGVYTRTLAPAHGYQNRVAHCPGTYKVNVYQLNPCN